MFKGIEKEDRLYELNKDPMLIYNQQLAEIVMEQLISPFLNPKYNNLYGWDQETSSNKEITKVEEFAGRAKIAISGA